MKPILYLTSELVNRDWDVRLMMADYAVKAGFSVVVGQQWAVVNNMDVLPPGLILVKTMNAIQGKAMAQMKQLGHLVVAMDEEALPLATDRDEAVQFLARGYSQPAISSCETFFANSPLHKKAIDIKMPDLSGKADVVGNARIDILSTHQRIRYAAEAQSLRDQYGPFILFNSNTASRNSIWDKEQFIDIQIRAGALDPNNPESISFFTDQLDFEEKNAAIFEGMLKWCAANMSSHTIVVRPHPSENLDYWTQFSAQNPRVHVAWATPHIPYMLASDIVIHTNCTTGIEAVALDKPTINLMPLPDSYWSKLYFAKDVSPTFGDLDSATTALKKHFQNAEHSLAPNAARRSALLRYYPSIEHARSAELMAEKMIQLLLSHGVNLTEAPGTEAFKNDFRHYKHSGTLKKKFSKTPEAAVAEFKATRLANRLTHGINLIPVADSLFLLRRSG